MNRDDATIARTVSRLFRTGNLELCLADLHFPIDDGFSDTLEKEYIYSPELFAQKFKREIPRCLIFFRKTFYIMSLCKVFENNPILHTLENLIRILLCEETVGHDFIFTSVEIRKLLMGEVYDLCRFLTFPLIFDILDKLLFFFIYLR